MTTPVPSDTRWLAPAAPAAVAPAVPKHSKEWVVLVAIAQDGDLTADEFVTRRGWYVNSWAPTFTALRQAGFIERTGDQRPTVHGAMAFVVRLTKQGWEALGVQS